MPRHEFISDNELFCFLFHRQGTNSAASRLGAMLSPFIKELNHMSHVSVSMAIFGLASLINAALVLQLPETKGKEIPDTIEQIEEAALRKKNAKSDQTKEAV